MSGTAHPLISVSELAAALAGEAPPAVLDVRWYLAGPPGIDSYRRGHVPEAAFVDLVHTVVNSNEFSYKF